MLGACGISAMAQYQLPNSDFESDFVVAFRTKTGTKDSNAKIGKEYSEPEFWHSYATIEALGVSGQGRDNNPDMLKIGEARPGSSGTRSVLIKSKETAGVVANGVLTTGRIYSNVSLLGITTDPKDPNKNYNYSDPNFSISSAEDTKSLSFSHRTQTFYPNNRSYAQRFTGHPDVFSVWVKYNPKEKSGFASANAVLHTDARYQDPEGKDYSNVKVAIAKKADITDYNVWRKLEIPFVYNNGNQQDPKYILVSFTTNAEPANGSDGDELYIDDIEMVYFHELKTASYAGTNLSFKEGETTNVNAVYNPKLFKVEEIKGKAATYIKKYDASTGILTVKVIAENISKDPDNYSVYKFQFKKPLSSSSFTDQMIVTIDGTPTEIPNQKISVYLMDDGTYTMALNEFAMPLDGTDTPVGNIVLTQLNPTVANATKLFNVNNTIEIASGDNYDDGDYIGPTLGLVPVDFSGKMAGNKFYCNIDIDMQESLGQTINVVFGKKIVPVTETAAVSSEDAGEAHVVLDRAFNAGWNTICLPFAFTASEIAEGAEAQEFKADHGNWLTFDPVEGKLEPNKPYLINVPTKVAAGKVFENKTIVAGAPVSVSNGKFTFTGVYEQKDMNGFYGVATVDGVTKIFQGGTNSNIMGTRAYFECSDKSISSVGIAFNGETTSISTITAPAAAAATGVYNLQGIKLNSTGSTAGLPAGLYIVNGQKVLVK